MPYNKFKTWNFLEPKITWISFRKSLLLGSISGDEKQVKGAEFFCRKNGRNALTGEVPPVYTSSDFRNTYVLNAFCGIDTETIPLYYRIHDGTKDTDFC